VVKEREAIKYVGYATLIAFGVLVGWYLRGQRERGLIQQRSEESRITTSEEVRALARRLSADAEWWEHLQPVPYTVELAQAMMPGDGSPILFIGTVIDIETTDSLTVVEFASSLSTFDISSLSLRVASCDESVLTELKDTEDRYLMDWAVISRVESIRRVPMDRELWEDEVRVASGDCREAIPLPKGYAQE
jgi:hypothetical protein